MAELLELSPEQREVVETWGRGMAVLAGAGSGKTTTLVVKCEELLKLRPEARFAAVSFTERSASDLREKLTLRLSALVDSSHGKGPLGQHWVMTIHALCGAIIREYPHEASFDGEETMLSEAEAELMWKKALAALWSDDLPKTIEKELDLLLARESRVNLISLLKRVRDLQSFGVLASLQGANDPLRSNLVTIASYVLERYERLKKRRGAIDFNDLERGADRVLDHPGIRALFHQRFDLLMVDEFQDTNVVQARILWRLAKPDLSNLCVVGDPKQSIYRFRDADVSVFEDCCSKLPERLSLTWNFRSRPGIIEFSNQVCAPAFAASGMSYDALVPKRAPSEQHAPVVRLELNSPMELAHWIKEEAIKGVPLHEMALLLRKIRGGNEKWIKALTAFGIPIALGSGGLFWEDPRVREMVAFLRWWENPANSLSGGVFLRAPWVGMPDDVIDRWVREDRTLWVPFFASKHPMAQTLKPLQDRNVARAGELLLALLINDEIEAELGAPLLGLWHRAEELSARGMDLYAVVQEFSRAMEDNRRERDVPPPKNLGQLPVLTLHGAKGLEFPHVILVDLSEKPARAQPAPLLFWDRSLGAYLAKRTADGDRDKKDPLESQWIEDEKRKELAESKRLFYVALTRAQERLVLVCESADTTSNKKPNAKPVADVFEKDFWRGWIDESCAELPRIQVARSDGVQGPISSGKTIAATIRQDAQISRPKGSQKICEQVSYQRPRHSVTEWNTLSRCPRAYEWTYVRPVLVTEGIPEIGLHSEKKILSFSETELNQRELGTLVHACLENGDFEGLRAIETEVGAQRFLSEPVISWAVSSPLMTPSRQDREVWSELAFEIPVSVNGRIEVLVGAIDRLICDRSGEKIMYSIVDFKVTEKLKSVDALLEAYQTQLELYAWALGRIEPEACEQVDAMLVNISARTVQVIPVEVRSQAERLGAKVRHLASLATDIVNGAVGKPSPGPLCRVCEFCLRCQNFDV